MGAESFPFRESFFKDLPEAFYAPAEPSPAPAPRWAAFNRDFAESLGLGRNADTPEMLNWLSGGAPPAGRQNIALAYAGHQFGHWNPMMGDGRAALVGEVHAATGVYDVHLKGSGPTVFARRGDGRATLAAMLREYILGEAMAGLNIPATRALAVTLTGARVLRTRAEPGAVLTRIARSHVRVGTFQYAAAQDRKAGQGPVLTKILLDACIARHFPQAAQAENPAVAFYDAVLEGQARLIARWMLVGFIHGVMNTDNMSIACETIDFGPCAFIDGFRADKTFSSIDEQGRYAYNQQPAIGGWNLARLAEALLPLLGPDQEGAIAAAQASLDRYQEIYGEALKRGLEGKLGLRADNPDNAGLIGEMWALLNESRADFTLFFRRLTQIAAGADPAQWLALFGEARPQADAFLANWRELGANDRLTQMKGANPIVIARNHRVEQALAAATEGDFGPFEKLCVILRRPFDEPPSGGSEDYEAPPAKDEEVQQTFCGT